MLFSRYPHDRLLLLRTADLIRLGIAGVVLAIAGCAAVPTVHSVEAYAGKSLEDQVKERATGRWTALMRGDLEGAYAYFSRPTKETYPMALYRAKMRPGMWREARVESVKCADGVCDVAVSLTVDHSKLKGITTPVTERWIVQDGLAWYVYNG